MIQDHQPAVPTGREDDAVAAGCVECDAAVVDAAATSLNCARCGQSQALCAGCMPANLPEHARDASWRCPECRERPLDA